MRPRAAADARTGIDELESWPTRLHRRTADPRALALERARLTIAEHVVDVGVGFAAGFGEFARAAVSKLEGVEFVYRWSGDAIAKMREIERRYSEDDSAERLIAVAR